MRYRTHIETLLDPRDLKARDPAQYQKAFQAWISQYYPEILQQVNMRLRCLLAIAELYGTDLTADETIVPGSTLPLAEVRSRLINGKQVKSRRFADRDDARRRSGRLLARTFQTNLTEAVKREGVEFFDPGERTRTSVVKTRTPEAGEAILELMHLITLTSVRVGVSYEFTYWCISHDFDVAHARQIAGMFAREAILGGPGKSPASLMDKLIPEMQTMSSAEFDWTLGELESGFQTTEFVFPNQDEPTEIVATAPDQVMAQLEKFFLDMNRVTSGEALSVVDSSAA